MQRTGSIAGTTVTFALLGPFVAGTAVFIPYAAGWATIGIQPVIDRSQLGALYMLCVLFAYWLGGLPALATGLAAALLSTRLKGLGPWVGGSVLIGLVVASVSVLVMGLLGGEPVNSKDFPGVLILFGGSAVLASAVGSLASNGFRPRMVPIPDRYEPEQEAA